MNITVTNNEVDYLTPLEKKCIKAILEMGLTEGKVKRKTYRIIKRDNEYDVYITENMTNWCEVQPRITTRKHTFIIN